MYGVITLVVQAVPLLMAVMLALPPGALSLGIFPANFGQNIVELAPCKGRRDAFSVRCARALEAAQKRTACRCAERVTEGPVGVGDTVGMAMLLEIQSSPAPAALSGGTVRTFSERC